MYTGNFLIVFTPYLCGPLDLQGEDVVNLLPSATLRSVKELTLQWETAGQANWSQTWGQLTQLTKLSLHCIDPGLRYFIPRNLKDLGGMMIPIRDLELTTSFAYFYDSRQDYVPIIRSGLSELRTLKIHVLLRAQEKLCWDLVTECLKNICREVCEWHTTHDVTYLNRRGVAPLDFDGEVRLLSFTFQR